MVSVIVVVVSSPAKAWDILKPCENEASLLHTAVALPAGIALQLWSGKKGALSEWRM
jgi:hypothetical protein